MSFIAARVLGYALTRGDASGRVVLAIASGREATGLKVSEIMTLTDLGQRAVEKGLEAALSHGMVFESGRRWRISSEQSGSFDANEHSLGVRTDDDATREQPMTHGANDAANRNSAFKGVQAVPHEEQQFKEALTSEEIEKLGPSLLGTSSLGVSSLNTKTLKTLKRESVSQKRAKRELPNQPPLEPNAVLGALPGFLEAWGVYLSSRSERRKPATQAAQSQALVKLERYHNSGFNPVLILEDTVTCDWTGLFGKEHHKYGFSAVSKSPSFGNTAPTARRGAPQLDLEDESRYEK